MPSIVYNSMVDLMAKGTIAFGSDSFKVLLVDSTYVPDKAAHTRRSDVTGEVNGIGYTAGGVAASVTVSTDVVADRTDIGLGGANWPAATVTAAGAVYYDSRGGAPEDDEVVAYIDFNGDVIAVGGLFALESSTVRIQNSSTARNPRPR